MKKTLFITTILATSLSFSQENNSANKLSIDFNFGLNKPTSSFTSGYTNKLNLYHTDLGIRYMLNTKCGVKLDVGIDNFTSTVVNYNYNTNYLRFSLQGIMNIGSIIGFNDSKFGLLLHGGAGTGSLGNNKIGLGKGFDDMVNVIVGITPQFKVSNKIALNFDLSYISNIYQNHKFDYKSRTNSRGFDGNFINASVGISYYLGKNEKHYDWSDGSDALNNQKIDSLELRLVNATKTLQKSTSGNNLNPTATQIEKPSLQQLQEQIKATETALVDTDKDGVADYLDLEPNTPAGVKVDKDGKEIKK
jgi:OOP family OmpA-OmpF porin